MDYGWDKKKCIVWNMRMNFFEHVILMFKKCIQQHLEDSGSRANSARSACM